MDRSLQISKTDSADIRFKCPWHLAETMWGKHTPLEEWSWLVGWPSLLVGHGPRTRRHPTQYHSFIQSACPFIDYLNGLYEIPYQHLCIFYVHIYTVHIYICASTSSSAKASHAAQLFFLIAPNSKCQGQLKQRHTGRRSCSPHPITKGAKIC